MQVIGEAGHHNTVDIGPLAIETEGLTKAFGGRTVVEDVCLRVPIGSIFGFLGPNGSGKTTTIRMILGLVYPDRGKVSVLGVAAPKAFQLQLSRLGAVVEGPGFYPYLSGFDNLRRFAQVAFPAQKRHAPSTRKISKADIFEALERVGLLDAKDKNFRAYSLGMKQRLAIAAALLWPRELLVLDEPTNGLDPQGIVEVRELLRSLQQQGMTIFVSSHILSEVEIICTEVAVMREGNLIFQGTTQAFRGSLGEQFTLETPSPGLAESILVQLGLVERDSVVIQEGRLTAKLTTDEIERVVAALVHGGVGIRAVGNSSHSLEEAFVALTGRSGHAR
ncbi:MAG: ATP-binding cassette domain-containing protein [Candidatus Marsarchaeota archaeon]|nr:ATP-binding cassette domain-containing protein [Candidatus Marsarchaeota archaeon]